MVKNMLPAGRAIGLGLLLLASGAMARAGSAGGAADPLEEKAPVITDWRTGLAMHGFDPVAYFSDAKAVRGLPELERTIGGATWQFCNEGNQAALAANPEVYRPRFAGYDPVAIGRGVATPGNPLVWVVANERLYLFHDPSTRAAFTADPPRVLALAKARWPTLVQTVRH